MVDGSRKELKAHSRYLLLTVNFPLVSVVLKVKKNCSLTGTGNAHTDQAVNKSYSLLLWALNKQINFSLLWIYSRQMFLVSSGKVGKEYKTCCSSGIDPLGSKPSNE